jgi:hypothetical protein
VTRIADVAARALAALALLVATTACEGRRPDAKPEGAVREVIERLRAAHGQPHSAVAAYELLSKATRENLEARARRYGAASGKNISPAAMLAPSSLVERWVGREYRAQIVGAHALVEVRGLLPEERTTIRCVWEDGGWRVVIDLPPLPEVLSNPREDGPQEIRRK